MQTNGAAPGPVRPSPRWGWPGGGRRLGLGVLLAFTVKGLFTTALMVAALSASAADEDAYVLPHVLCWLMAVGIGGVATVRRA